MRPRALPRARSHPVTTSRDEGPRFPRCTLAPARQMRFLGVVGDHPCDRLIVDWHSPAQPLAVRVSLQVSARKRCVSTNLYLDPRHSYRSIRSHGGHSDIGPQRLGERKRHGRHAVTARAANPCAKRPRRFLAKARNALDLHPQPFSVVLERPPLANGQLVVSQQLHRTIPC